MRATLGTALVELTPEQPAEVVVEVTNTSEVIDGVTASLDLGDGLSVVSDPAFLALFPDGTGTITLSITASSTFPARTYLATVELRSAVRPEDAVSLPLDLEVTPHPAASLDVAPPVRRGRSRQTFGVVCANSGNTPVELSFAASDPTRAVLTEFTPASLTVQPDASATTELAVLTKRQWFGSEVRRPLSIVATSRAQDVEVTATATFLQQPVIPRGVRTALVLGMIVALWAVVFIYALDRAFAKDALTKQAPASFYVSTAHHDPGSDQASTAATVAAVCKGGATATAPPGVVPKSGVAIGVGGTVSGTVTTLNTGTGIGRITVQAWRDAPCGPEVVSSAATSSDGSYSLVGLLPGPYQILFTATGYKNVWYGGATTRTASTPVTVEAQKVDSGKDAVIDGLPGSISGTVLTGQTPPATVTVTVQAEQGSVRDVGTVQTGSNGNYSVPALPTPGTYDLSFTAPGYAVASDVEELGGGEARIANTVSMTASPGIINGSVTSNSHVPLGGVSITAAANGKTFTSATPTTGAIGRFTIANLPTPATYLLTFTLTGYGTQTQAVNLGPGQVISNLAVVLSGGAGSVSGTVTSSSGAPLGGVTVTVNGGTQPISTQTLTAGQVGAYQISGLPTPGDYTLSFSLPGYASETIAVPLVSNGSASGVNVTLPAVSGVISGTVVGPPLSGTSCGGSSPCTTPLVGVQVSVSDGSTTRTTVTTSSPPGGFSFSGLAPGSYTVTFSFLGYAPQTTLVQLQPGGFVNLPTTLQAG
jgi:hypothetical protein